MDKILQDYGVDGRVLTWEQLAEKAGIEDVCGRTIRTHMGSLEYRKCLACKKGWISKKAAEYRVNWASTQLSQHSDKEYWRTIRFSDEMHSGFNSEYTLYIICRPEERYCPDCI